MALFCHFLFYCQGIFIELLAPPFKNDSLLKAYPFQKSFALPELGELRSQKPETPPQRLRKRPRLNSGEVLVGPVH